MSVFRKYGLPLSVVTVLALSGCLVSGTFVIVLAIAFSAQTTDGFNKESVDLNSNPTYADHNEDIKRITNVLFELTYNNNEATALTGEVWLSTGDYSDATAVRNAADAVEIMGGLTLATGQNVLTFQESGPFRMNILNGLQFIDDNPQFFLYAFPDSPVDMDITKIRLMITLDAGQAN